MSDTPLTGQYLETLYDITRTLNSTLDLSEVLENVMDRVIQVTGAERGFLMLRDAETGILDFRVARGIDRQDLEKPKFQVSRTIVNQVADSGEPLLADNAANAFSNHQSVVMMALRSILCVPITVKDRMLGLVYVDNRIQIGAFDDKHLALVTAFASQAGIAIENARLYEIAIEQGRMQRELEMAHTIQQGLLPTSFSGIPGYEVALYWDSAGEVAGDFYDGFILQDGAAMGIVIADVSGKGAPAAIFMAVARSLIRGNATATPSVTDMLRQTNRLIMDDAGSSGMFVTVYYTIFQAGGVMLAANAGHNQPLLYRHAEQWVEWLPRGGRALGWFDDLPVEVQTYQLAPGDIVIYYTDGITEAENAHKEQFGEARLAEIVEHAAGQLAPEALKDQVVAHLLQFVGDAPPFDDQTLVIVQYTGKD